MAPLLVAGAEHLQQLPGVRGHVLQLHGRRRLLLRELVLRELRAQHGLLRAFLQIGRRRALKLPNSDLTDVLRRADLGVRLQHSHAVQIRLRVDNFELSLLHALHEPGFHVVLRAAADRTALNGVRWTRDLRLAVLGVFQLLRDVAALLFLLGDVRVLHRLVLLAPLLQLALLLLDVLHLLLLLALLLLLDLVLEDFLHLLLFLEHFSLLLAGNLLALEGPAHAVHGVRRVVEVVDPGLVVADEVLVGLGLGGLLRQLLLLRAALVVPGVVLDGGFVYVLLKIFI